MAKTKRLKLVTPNEADNSPVSMVGTKRWRETVPRHLQVPLAKALRAMEANDLAQALKWFGECAELDPFSKPVLYFGGQVAAQGYFALRGRDAQDPNLPQWREIAETLVRAAYEVAPDDAVACHNVGRFLQDVGDDTEAIRYYRHAIMLDSGQVETWGNLGTALYQTGDVEGAWQHWQKCIALPAELSSGKLAQSYIWLRNGNYKDGWAAFNERWKDLSFAQGYSRDKELGGIHWLGGTLPKKHALFLHGEQGLGDHVQFARFVRTAQAKGLNVVGLETRGILTRWMEAAFPDVLVITRDSDNPYPTFTHHCSTMDLPALLGTLVDYVPVPIRPDVAPLCREQFVDTLHVGIAWKGATGNTADAMRSINAEALRHLADIPGVTFVSLQFSPDAAIEGRAWLGRNFIDGTEGCQDVLDTAAVIRGLDMVISVDTLTAHLAGTLGIPTWILHRFCREWRWLDQGERSPWYPSVRNFTQSEPGNWDELLLRVRHELEMIPREVPEGGHSIP